MSRKAGFVSIVGKPNVGKSTLLNRLIGCKLAGVSPKPQTTRQVIRGILTESRGQIVFLDTPGLHAPRDHLGERMLREIREALPEADLIYWMVAPELPQTKEREIAEDLRKQEKPVFLVLNKVDAVAKLTLLPALEAYNKLDIVDALFPVSALTGENTEVLLAKTFERLPEHPAYFPDDRLSNHSERFIVSEKIREKIFQLTGEEIPYATAVEIHEFKEKSENLVVIEATIYVEKKSQRGILIGQSGQMVKRIGQAARKDIEMFLGKRVFLQLWVKDRKDWKKDDRFLDRIEKEGKETF